MGDISKIRTTDGVDHNIKDLRVDDKADKATTYTKTEVDTALSGKTDKVTTSTDNAVVRFNGTSGNIQNSGVTINDSNHLTAAKLITSGGTSSQVVLGDGTLKAAKELPQYEAYLQWGGKNFAGDYGCIDAAMVSELGAPRTMFVKPSCIVVEYSTDGGTTWLDYGATDAMKAQLFSLGGAAFYIGKNTVAGGSSANYMLRVTLHTGGASLYTTLNKFVIYVSTNGSSGCYCTIRCRTQENYENNVDTWVTKANQVSIRGWSGYNVINIAGTSTYGNTKSTQYGEWQFIFGCTGFSGNYYGLNVQKIIGFGGVGWSTPSNMAKTGHLYSYDSSQNAIFPANLTAHKFITSDGTSSQFVKGDGSLDSTSYATESYVDDAIADKADSATTLAGYGITDAKIENGIITLGSNTITPITSHLDITGKVDKVSSSTDNAIVRFDGTTGAIQNSSATVSDNGSITVYDLVVHGNNDTNNTRMISSSNATNLVFRVESTAKMVINPSRITTGTGQTVDLGSSSIPWNNVYGASFITTGGTSSQFVKGDGSLDSTVYATKAQLDSALGDIETLLAAI